MKLYSMLRSRVGPAFYLILSLLVLSGLANLGALASLNRALAAGEDGAGRDRLAFAGAVLVFLVSQRIANAYLIGLTQRLVSGIRSSILERIRNAEYQDFIRIGSADVLSSLTQDAITISHTAIPLATSFTSFLTVTLSFAYLAWISPAAAGLTALFTAAGTAVFLVRQKELVRQMGLARDEENRFLRSLEDLTGGFKELRLSRSKAADLYDNHLEDSCRSAEKLNIRSLIGFMDNDLFSRLMFFLLIALIAFPMPWASDGPFRAASAAILVLFYASGSLSSLIALAPRLAATGIAMGRIAKLEAALAPRAVPGPPPAADRFPSTVSSLSLEGIRFSHLDAQGGRQFQLGPLDFEVGRGQCLFIVGGNGSGKSTLFRILAGLTVPQTGTLRCNGIAVDGNSRAEYRERVAAIFSDNHVFETLYGVAETGVKGIQARLKGMDMLSKVAFAGKRVSARLLSTGQRKRLALAVALEEDRPIYLFDEWAADQDPHFRRRFYREILPDLKERGKIIIAVTHDDRYFDVADGIVRLEEGRQVEEPRALDGSGGFRDEADHRRL